MAHRRRAYVDLLLGPLTSETIKAKVETIKMSNPGHALIYCRRYHCHHIRLPCNLHKLIY